MQNGAPSHTAKYVNERPTDCLPHLFSTPNPVILQKEKGMSSIPKVQATIRDILDNLDPKYHQKLL